MNTLKPKTKKDIGRQYAFTVFLLRGMKGQLRYIQKIRWVQTSGLVEHLQHSIDNTLVLLREEYLEQRELIKKER